LDTEIIDDLTKVFNKNLSLKEFLNTYWERFKPVYISVFKYIEDDGDLYILVHKFFTKIIRSDVQPCFQSDNQLFSYFKTAVKNEKYDLEHKKEVQVVLFSELENKDSESEYSFEDYIADNSIPFDDTLSGEIFVDKLLKELSESLSESYIQVVILLYKGYNLKEIRKMLGISYSAVNDRIWVIRNLLKNKYKILEDLFIKSKRQ